MALILVLVALVAITARLLLGDAWTLEAIGQRVDGAGAWAPLAFVAVYALATVLLLPGAPLTIAAGLLFGPIVGVACAWAGASLGASGAYGIARAGRGAPHAWLHRRFARATRFVEERSLGSVLLLRLVPLVPFNALNYGLGFAGVPPRAYVLGTMIGILPGTTAYVLFGAAAGSSASFTSPSFYVPLGIAIALAAIGYVVARRLSPRVAHA